MRCVVRVFLVSVVPVTGKKILNFAALTAVCGGGIIAITTTSSSTDIINIWIICSWVKGTN